ncbi:MAG: response regulator [Clostridiales Family XIII bacterium]|nr:response regulator [Clostridiales Family XIII bacterium]
MERNANCEKKQRDRQKIVLVDDNIANLTIGKNMLKDIYEVYAVPSALKLFEVLERIAPSLILLDVEMPEMNGHEVIRRLKSDETLAEIPVIFLTSKNDEASELKGLDLGAIDYVKKPFSAPLLRRRIKNYLQLVSQKKELRNYADNLMDMVDQKTSQVMNLQNSLLTGMAEMVEFRDNMTGGHITRTQKYLEVLVDRLIESGKYRDETSAWDLTYLLPSAQLHDIGKIAICDAILNKPGKLTEDEFEKMKEHAELGVRAIERIERSAEECSFLRYARIIAGTHHEKWDGSGYPKGLVGKDIPLEGRLMAVADVYDALISARPYKKPLTANEANEIIESGSGSHFDPVLIDIFRSATDRFEAIAASCN